MGIRLSRLPATLLALLLPGLVQAAPPGLDRFEGLWESSVVVQDCHSGAVLRTFRGLTVIHRGGTASATNSLPTVANGPAYGTWSRDAAAGTYTIRLRLYRYEMGVFAGPQDIVRTVTLSPDGQQLSGSLLAQFLDPNENLLFTSCGSETARRLASE